MPWRFIDRKTDFPDGRRLLSELWVGEQHPGLYCAGRRYEISDRPHRHCVLRAALRPFTLLKAFSCVNSPGSCENQFPSEPCLAWPRITSEQVSAVPSQRVENLGFSANHSTFYFTNCLFVLAAHISSWIAIPVALCKNPCV